MSETYKLGILNLHLQRGLSGGLPFAYETSRQASAQAG